MTKRCLRISPDLWEQTWAGLLSHGGGEREAACLWAGTRNGALEIVREVLFFEDFGETNQGPLHHRIPRNVTAAMFAHLQSTQELILADVHTHPGRWVDLSPVDSAHPIEYRIGLLALVIPAYAKGRRVLSRVGVHEYLGEGQWRTLREYEAYRRIAIGAEEAP